MKEIWARIGMSVKITDEEYNKIKQLAINEESTESHGYEVFDDLDVFPEWLEKKFETEGTIDGDCYIPGDTFC